MTRQYRAAAGRARNAGEKTAGFWTRGARTVTDLVPGLPRVDLVPAVERYFELVQRTVDISRDLTWSRQTASNHGARPQHRDAGTQEHLLGTGGYRTELVAGRVVARERRSGVRQSPGSHLAIQ